MNYNNIISKLREQARHKLRLILVNGYRDALHCLNSALRSAKTTCEEYIESSEQNINIAKYNLTKLDPEDPLAKEKTEAANKTIESQTKAIEKEKDIMKEAEENHKKQADLINEKINKIQTGEIKVDAMDLTVTTELLINNFMEALVSNEANNLTTQDDTQVETTI